MTVQEAIDRHKVNGKVPESVDIVVREFIRCTPWISSALSHGNGTHTMDDILVGLLTGEYLMWPAQNSCVITEIIETPRKKILNYFLAGGNLDELDSMREPVEDWARKAGCSAVMLIGRKGWAKSFLKGAGYESRVMMSKELA